MTNLPLLVTGWPCRERRKEVFSVINSINWKKQASSIEISACCESFFFDDCTRRDKLSRFRAEGETMSGTIEIKFRRRIATGRRDYLMIELARELISF